MKQWFIVAALISPALAQAQTAHEAFAKQLVDRQARAWETHDFALAKPDWLPTAVLTSPDGNTPAADIGKAMDDYFKDFGDLKVTVKNLIVSPDGNKLALEWDWSIVRKRDGYHGISHDAILVDLENGKIASWREYFDPAASGEAKQ